MKFGKVRFNPDGLIGMTKTEFKKQYVGKDFRPYSIDEVWEQLKPHIPKKSK
jgi:hypothetical protein